VRLAGGFLLLALAFGLTVLTALHAGRRQERLRPVVTYAAAARHRQAFEDALRRDRRLPKLHDDPYAAARILRARTRK
jgi:hypothetical protein